MRDHELFHNFKLLNFHEISYFELSNFAFSYTELLYFELGSNSEYFHFSNLIFMFRMRVRILRFRTRKFRTFIFRIFIFLTEMFHFELGFYILKLNSYWSSNFRISNWIVIFRTRVKLEIFILWTLFSYFEFEFVLDFEFSYFKLSNFEKAFEFSHFELSHFELSYFEL